MYGILLFFVEMYVTRLKFLVPLFFSTARRRLLHVGRFFSVGFTIKNTTVGIWHSPFYCRNVRYTSEVSGPPFCSTARRRFLHVGRFFTC
jgi:hypothetical protein